MVPIRNMSYNAHGVHGPGSVQQGSTGVAAWSLSHLHLSQVCVFVFLFVFVLVIIFVKRNLKVT